MKVTIHDPTHEYHFNIAFQAVREHQRTPGQARKAQYEFDAPDGSVIYCTAWRRGKTYHVQIDHGQELWPEDVREPHLGVKPRPDPGAVPSLRPGGGCSAGA